MSASRSIKVQVKKYIYLDLIIALQCKLNPHWQQKLYYFLLVFELIV